jgi:NADP-dependent 3-hydroxy acid dehydrogenase YdfG
VDVFITGATAGFGAAMAKRFAKAGHRAIAAGRREDRLIALASELADFQVHMVVLDVRDRHAVKAAIDGPPAPFVRQFSLNLRADLRGTRVRVTDVAPGLVGGTEFSSVRLKGDQDRVSKIYEGADALTPDDIAETVFWAATLPERVNINCVELMPVSQSFAGFAIHRVSNRAAEVSR